MVQSNPIKRHPLFKNHLDLLFPLRNLVLKIVGVFYDSPLKQSNAIDQGWTDFFSQGPFSVILKVLGAAGI